MNLSELVYVWKLLEGSDFLHGKCLDSVDAKCFGIYNFREDIIGIFCQIKIIFLYIHKNEILLNLE